MLTALGLTFDVVTAEVTELDGTTAPHLSPAGLATENARLKAGAVAQRMPGRWVLGADTVVTLAGRIFGKPGSPAEAREFLRSLGGKKHEVITGVVLLDPAGRPEQFHDISVVTFRPLTGDDIARYLAEVDVLDKAGGYALQERGEWIVAGVEGSRSNVIGLPVEKLSALLHARGLLQD